MRIINVTATFSPESIKAALTILLALKEKTLSTPVCKEYEVFIDPDQPSKVFIHQLWETEEAFEAYRTSEEFNKMGAQIGPMMTTTPQTVIYEAQVIM